jgi:hypothetical protein
MAIPTRRGDRDRSEVPTGQPTAWDSVAAPPANADPLAQLRPFNPLVALLDDLRNSRSAIASVAGQGATTPLADLADHPGAQAPGRPGRDPADRRDPT